MKLRFVGLAGIAAFIALSVQLVSPAIAANQPAHPGRIAIGNFTFAPATIEIAAGSQLEWVNEDDVPHTVLGSDPQSPLRSPAMDTDDHYTVTLDKPGVYKYFCSLHPHMVGTVIVK